MPGHLAALFLRGHRVARKTQGGGALPLGQPVLDTHTEDALAYTITFGRSLHRIPFVTTVAHAIEAYIT